MRTLQYWLCARVRVCLYGRFREEEQCSDTPNPLLPKGCEKQVGVPSKTLQQWHVQSDLSGSVCAERLSAADATNMSSASTASTARSHGSKGEKWREMAVGRYVNAFTNCIYAPSTPHIFHIESVSLIFWWPTIALQLGCMSTSVIAMYCVLSYGCYCFVDAHWCSVL